MAVTGRKLPRTCLASVAAVYACILFAAPMRADRPASVRAQISYIGTALTAGNAADAMVPFDKSFTDYERLRGYFLGLNAFQVENEFDIVDEQDTADDSKLTVTWNLTLTDFGSDRTERRSADINIRLVLKNGKWKIVDFAPIDIFNPLQKRMPKN